MNDGSLTWVVRHCCTVLFDFDGPLCDVFVNRPAAGVARDLEGLAGRRFDTNDPLEVLRSVYALDQDAGHVVEDALVQAEVDAVRVSIPDAGGVAALRSFASEGRRVAIVSNNSQAAVEEFLDMHQLQQAVSIVVGRAHRRPDLMKPDPWSVRRAVEHLGVTPTDAFLIGDSMTDIEAARRAGTHCVAYANKPAKVDPFRATGVPTITSMTELATAKPGR
ncbi:MAG: HAD family hydrolase [Pseudonocardia sp.]